MPPTVRHCLLLSLAFAVRCARCASRFETPHLNLEFPHNEKEAVFVVAVGSFQAQQRNFAWCRLKEAKKNRPQILGGTGTATPEAERKTV